MSAANPTARTALMHLLNQVEPGYLERHFGPACEIDTVADALLAVHLSEVVPNTRAEALAEIANPANAATIYAVRPCICDDTPHPRWCPASVPTDERIKEIRQGLGEPLTPRELSWLGGTAGRHELHVIGSRGGHWPLTDDLPGALLLVSQYLAAAVAVIERAGLAEEEATASSGETTQTADFFQPGHTYSHGQDGYKAPEQTLIFRVEHVTRHPDKGHRRAIGWSRTGEPGARWHGDFRDEGEFEGWTETTDGGDA
jgi:hypothetical protein